LYVAFCLYKVSSLANFAKMYTSETFADIEDFSVGTKEGISFCGLSSAYMEDLIISNELIGTGDLVFLDVIAPKLQNSGC